MAAFLAASETDGFSIHSVKLADDIHICVKMSGPQWDGKFDYKIAEYIILLQKSVLSAYNSISGKPPLRYNRSPMDDANLRVTVSVEQGSSIVDACCEAIISWPVEAQIGVSVFGIMAFLITLASVKNHKADKENETTDLMIKKNVEQNVKMFKTFEKIIGNLSDKDKNKCNEKLDLLENAIKENKLCFSHMHYLTQKMEKDDTMQINNEIVLTKNQASERFTAPIKNEDSVESSEFQIDGDYIIRSHLREKDSINVVMDDGKARLFSMKKLNDDIYHEVMRECAIRIDDDNKLKPTSLWLTACFRGGVFSGGFVDGVVSSPSEGAVSFADAQKQSIEDAEKLENE